MPEIITQTQTPPPDPIFASGGMDQAEVDRTLNGFLIRVQDSDGKYVKLFKRRVPIKCKYQEIRFKPIATFPQHAPEIGVFTPRFQVSVEVCVNGHWGPPPVDSRLISDFLIDCDKFFKEYEAIG
jgi:hypothetical protein